MTICSVRKCKQLSIYFCSCPSHYWYHKAVPSTNSGLQALQMLQESTSMCSDCQHSIEEILKDWHLHKQRDHQNLHHKCPILFINESKVVLITCNRYEKALRCHDKCFAACNIIQNDWIGGGLMMVWGGTVYPWRVTQILMC